MSELPLQCQNTDWTWKLPVRKQRKKLDLSTQLPFMQAASCIAYGVTFPKTPIYDDQKL